MSDNSSHFRELYELYRLTYLVYLAGEELRAIDRNHPLLRFLNHPDDAAIGREFLRQFADYDGSDPPLSVTRQAHSRYHAALTWTLSASQSAG